jgi:hydroxymethylpyrimidine/phosphomethylpyrimidine kinase
VSIAVTGERALRIALPRPSDAPSHASGFLLKGDLVPARPVRLSCALAIGGLDPGGGAGIAADLRAFAAAGVFGCAAVALLTVQSTAGLVRSFAVPASEVTAQAEEVLRRQRVRALKIGALGDADNVRAVAKILRRHASVPAVVDTPMTPSRGRGRLLEEGALAVVRDTLALRATLLTVNAEEAGRLFDAKVTTVEDARVAARTMAAHVRAVLVKGGHLAGPTSTDVLAIGDRLVELRAPRLRIGPTHGTGCTLASLVAGRLARRAGERVTDDAIVEAVRWAKRVHHAALARAADVGQGARVIAFARR